MNPHFRRDGDLSRQLPSRTYGRLDHLQWPGPGATDALLAFDLVDADWVDRQGRRDPRFDLDHPRLLADAWHDWWSGLNTMRPRINPFEHAPLFRMEVELPANSSWFDFPLMPDPRDRGMHQAMLGALEAQWFEFELDRIAQPGAFAAVVYPGLFANPIAAFTKGKMPSVKKGRALSGIFSLANLPKISTAGLGSLLSQVGADLLAVYDVGQGNANALLAPHTVPTPLPTLYYDLGAGIYRNKHTTPFPLAFCFTSSPPIVLSHWDADHWAGTYATMVGGIYPALHRQWIAPDQQVGPVHTAFAYDVVCAGGSVHLYVGSAGHVGLVPLPKGRALKFTTGTGGDRNGTGIVIAVDNATASDPCSWILTGDCDYQHFMNALVPLPPVAMVAPHHGADLDPASPVPGLANARRYCRLVYSFGSGNLHGKTRVQHPTMQGVTLHAGAGWDHGAWSLMTPGMCVPGADVLATGQHPSGGGLGGVLVGWNAPPPPFAAACGGKACSCTPVQS